MLNFWLQASQAALALFAFGQQEAAKRGLLLVDTKYEFGKDAEGKILLIDEIHTPDSSRYVFSLPCIASRCVCPRYHAVHDLLASRVAQSTWHLN